MSDEKLLKKQTKKVKNFSYNNKEITFHAIFLSLNVAYALWRIPMIALQSQDQYTSCQSLLSPYLGFKRDCHDDQWQSYRNNMPALIQLIIVWELTSRILSINKKSTVLGLGLCLFSFRADCLLYFLLLAAWFQFTKIFCKKKWIVPFVWIFTIVLLYLNQMFDHLRPISAVLDSALPDSLQFIKSKNAPIHWANILNMSLLKLISFTTDNHREQEKQQLENHRKRCQECSQKELCEKGRDFYVKPAFTFINFLNYILFAPVFLAGPPIPYKNYHSFYSMPTSKKPEYLRWIIVVISFEIFLHLYPVLNPKQNQTLIDVELLSLFALVFLWYKFLIIWKTGRLWSLMCGVDVVDNMSRCLFNNYGFEGFWRMWHRGFSHWIKRYLFIPLGGNKKVYSYFCVIAFVAFWHDHTINIILWAFILVLFMIPQIAIKAFFAKKFNYLYDRYWFKYLSAVVSALYIYLLCLANLIGFGYGYQKANIVVQKILSEWQSTLYSVVVVTSAINLMFYFRHLQGNKKNY